MQRGGSASSFDGLMSIVVLLTIVVAFFLTGVFTYNLIEPDGFFGIVIFLLSWGVLWAIVQFVLSYIFVAIAAIFS